MARTETPERQPSRSRSSFNTSPPRGADRLLQRIGTLVQDGRRRDGASLIELEVRRQEIERLKARLADLVKRTADER
jgi:hypothetical protein